jgi:hypothetical protein
MNPDQWITSFSTLIKSVARAIINKCKSIPQEEVQFSPAGVGVQVCASVLEPNNSTLRQRSLSEKKAGKTLEY